MNLGSIIEVAIGLIFIWLILSLSTIQIQEWIASFLNYRERDLEKAIGQMLANSQLTKDFYKHPLIQAFIEKPGKKPAYIPPREFAQALFNIVTTAGTENSAIQQALASIKTEVIAKNLAGFWEGWAKNSAEKTLDQLIQNAENLTATDQESIIEQIKNMDEYKKLATVPGFETAVNKIPEAVQKYLDALKNAKLGSDLVDLTPAQIEAGINAIGKINSSFGRTMQSMIAGVNNYADQAEKGLANARANVESWFNGSMESLSGWYKRRSQFLTFFIGFFLALTLNVNSIALVQRLWIDPTVRAALLENASAFQLPNSNPTNGTATGTPESTGADPANAAATSVPGETNATEVVAPADTIQNFQAQFEGLELPLGWVAVPIKDFESLKLQCALFPQWVKNPPPDTTLFQGITFFNKEVCYRPSGTTVPLTSTTPPYEEALKTNWLFTWLVGILISAVATTQGAPFWFDILTKLINLRGAGARPPTTQESMPQK